MGESTESCFGWSGGRVFQAVAGLVFVFMVLNQGRSEKACRICCSKTGGGGGEGPFFVLVAPSHPLSFSAFWCLVVGCPFDSLNMFFLAGDLRTSGFLPISRPRLRFHKTVRGRDIGESGSRIAARSHLAQ